MRAATALVGLLSAPSADGVPAVLDDALRYVRTDVDPLKGAQAAVDHAASALAEAQKEAQAADLAFSQAQSALSSVTALSACGGQLSLAAGEQSQSGVPPPPLPPPPVGSSESATRLDDALRYVLTAAQDGVKAQAARRDKAVAAERAAEQAHLDAGEILGRQIAEAERAAQNELDQRRDARKSLLRLTVDGMAPMPGLSVILAELAEASTRLLARAEAAERERDALRDALRQHGGGPESSGVRDGAGSGGSGGGDARGGAGQRRGGGGGGGGDAPGGAPGKAVKSRTGTNAGGRSPLAKRAKQGNGGVADDDDHGEAGAFDGHGAVARLREAWGDELFTAIDAKVKALRVVQPMPPGYKRTDSVVPRAGLYEFIWTHKLADVSTWSRESWNVRGLLLRAPIARARVRKPSSRPALCVYAHARGACTQARALLI